MYSAITVAKPSRVGSTSIGPEIGLEQTARYSLSDVPEESRTSGVVAGVAPAVAVVPVAL